MTQVLDLVKMALQMPGFMYCIRDPFTAHQALKPLYSVLGTCHTWDKQLQLTLASSIRPLVPGLLQLLDDLGVQLNLIKYEDAIWASTSSTLHVLLEVLRLLLGITGWASAKIDSSSSSAAQSSVTQVFVATGKLLGRISATLQLVAPIPDAAQRAACQKRLLTAGHAAHDLLAPVKHPDVLAKCPFFTLDNAISMALSAARILWFEDVVDQHEIAARVVTDFDDSVFIAYKSGVKSQTDAAIELVMSAGESGAMLQGPLSAAKPLHWAAVDAWARWLLRSAKHMKALLDGHSRTRLRDVHSSCIHRLAAAACVQLERLLSADNAGVASCTRWQGRIITSCSNAATDLATMTALQRFGQADLFDSMATVRKTYVAAQPYMLAMAHTGVLQTFPGMARWLLVRNREVGSVESPETEDLISRLISVPYMIGTYLVTIICCDRYSPLNRPPQQEVRNNAVTHRRHASSLSKSSIMCVQLSNKARTAIQ